MAVGVIVPGQLRFNIGDGNVSSGPDVQTVRDLRKIDVGIFHQRIENRTGGDIEGVAGSTILWPW